MAGTAHNKEVKSVFSIIDHASHTAHKMAEKMEKLHEKSERAKEAVERTLAPKLAAVGLALGFGEMAAKMYEVGEAAEESTRAITGAYVMSGRFGKLGAGEEMATSLEKAEDAYGKLEAMAMKGVSSTQTYINTFQALSPIMAKTKAKSDDMLDVTGELVLRLRAIGHSGDMAAEAARGLSNAIATGAGRPSKEMLKVLHMSTKEWQHLIKLGPEKMWLSIRKHVEETKKPLDKMFHGPGTAMQRLKNTAEHFMRVLGEPMMEELGAQAEKLVKWLSANKDQAKAIAKEFADKVVTGIHYAVEGAKLLAQHWKPLLAGLGAIMVAPKMIGTATVGLKLIAALRKGAEGAEELGAKSLSSEKCVQKYCQSLGIGGEEVQESAKKSGGLLSKASAKLGQAMAVAAVAVASFELGEWLAEKTGLADAIAGKLSALEDAKTPGEQSKAIGSVISDPFALASLGYAKIMGKSADKDIAENEKILKQYHGEALKRVQLAKTTNMHHQLTLKKAKGAADSEGDWAKGWKPEKAENNYDFRGSRFDIKQAFAEGFDPDRIAVAFTNDLAKLGERRLQSGYSPVFGAR